MRKAFWIVLIVALAAVSGWSAASAPAPAADEPSWYDRLGGVYGIAPLVDTLVDRLWDNPTLIANKQYVLWRRAHQKVGVKFLLTASFCHAAGGPEQNLGAHLMGLPYLVKLTDDQWPAVWSDIELVVSKSKLSPEVQHALLDEVRLLKPRLQGGKPPALPSHARSTGLGDVDESGKAPQTTLYQELGFSDGIAGIVEVFVGRLFNNQTIMANRDLGGVTGRLTSAGVKFQLTSLLCEATGGPERYTPVRVLDRGTVIHVTAAEWNAMRGELQFAMARRYVSPDAQGRLLELVESVRPMVVNTR